MGSTVQPVQQQNQTAEEVDTSGTYPEVQGPTNDGTDNVTQTQDDIPTPATDELNDDDDHSNNIGKSVTLQLQFQLPRPKHQHHHHQPPANRKPTNNYFEGASTYKTKTQFE